MTLVVYLLFWLSAELRFPGTSFNREGICFQIAQVDTLHRS